MKASFFNPRNTLLTWFQISSSTRVLKIWGLGDYLEHDHGSMLHSVLVQSGAKHFPSCDLSNAILIHQPPFCQLLLTLRVAQIVRKFPTFHERRKQLSSGEWRSVFCYGRFGRNFDFRLHGKILSRAGKRVYICRVRRKRGTEWWVDQMETVALRRERPLWPPHFSAGRLTLLLWRWKRNITPKYQYLCTTQGIISQKTIRIILVHCR